MTTKRTNFGLRTIAAVMFLGLVGAAASAGSDPLAHSDVPDLPSMQPFSGTKDGWTSAPGKTAIKFEDGPIWIGEVAGEDLNLENAPPPALTSIAPIEPPTSGGFVAPGSGPTVTNGGVFVPASSSSIPAPSGVVLFGFAAALGARRRR